VNIFKPEDYTYIVPERLIARTPIEPRDAAKVLIYDTQTNTVHIDTFANIAQYMDTQSIVVMNTTKVVPARVVLHKETGGKIEVLFLVNEQTGDDTIKAIVDRKLEAGTTLSIGNYIFNVVRQDEQFFFLHPQFPMEQLTEFFESYGTTPTPKYLGKQSLSEDKLRERYQSLLAQTPASVAAPTASLHFTENVFQSLKEKEISVVPVTLHVGMGTFAPLSEIMIKENKLHTEWYEIPDTSITAIQQNTKRPIVAVGTTVVRTLESYAQSHATNGATDIFIKPPFDFTMVDQLITNFHVPQSSLMCLVDAFLKYKGAKRSILDLYTIAIQNNMRFFSFGDAMYIR